jgi:hypothetical protein
MTPLDQAQIKRDRSRPNLRPATRTSQEQTGCERQKMDQKKNRRSAFLPHHKRWHA